MDHFPSPKRWRHALHAIVDFAVTGIQLPAAAVAGSHLRLSWTVLNQSTNDAAGLRSDAVYLSSDGTLDRAQVLEYSPSTNALGSGQSVILSNIVVLPLGVTGTFYIIVAADGLYQYYEADGEGNNAYVSTNTITLTPLAPRWSLSTGNFLRKCCERS